MGTSMNSRGTFSPQSASLLDVEAFLTMHINSSLTRNMWRRCKFLTEMSI